MKTLVPLIVLLLLLTGCASLDADSAQGALEKYSFAVEGQSDGLIAANARYIAVDAQVTLTVRFRNRDSILWEQTFQRDSGRRAYRIVFNEDDEFVQMQAVPWEAARGSLTWLPGDPAIDTLEP